MKTHGGNVYTASLATGIPVTRLLDFSASINPLGLSKATVAAIREGIGLVPHYPEPFAGSLASAIAGHFKISAASLLCGNGSTELIYLIPRVLKPKTVLVTAPAFSEYEKACGAGSIRPKIKILALKKEDNFDIDPARFIQSMRGCDMAFLCNPNNPTGRLLRKKEVIKIAGAARKLRCYLVVDEAFIDFCLDESVIQQVKRNPYLIVLRSMTKFYALAGLRIGFGVFPLKLAAEIKKQKEPWTINIIADMAARAALEDYGYRLKTLRIMKLEKRFMEKGLSNMGITFVPSEANYYLLRLKSAAEVRRTLESKGILVRDCSNFEGLDGTYIRIAVRSRAENSMLLRELSGICAG